MVDAGNFSMKDICIINTFFVFCCMTGDWREEYCKIEIIPGALPHPHPLDRVSLGHPGQPGQPNETDDGIRLQNQDAEYRVPKFERAEVRLSAARRDVFAHGC